MTRADRRVSISSSRLSSCASTDWAVVFSNLSRNDQSWARVPISEAGELTGSLAGWALVPRLVTRLAQNNSRRPAETRALDTDLILAGEAAPEQELRHNCLARPADGSLYNWILDCLQHQTGARSRDMAPRDLPDFAVTGTYPGEWWRD